MEQYILGQLAMRDVHIHRPTEAAQICRAALDDGATGAARTMFTLRAARPAAQMGEDTPALDLIEETRSRHLEGPRTHDPAWAWWLTEAEIAWHHAMIYTDTGRWDRAIERFTAACERPDEYAWASRISQASLLWALAHAQAWDEAETVLIHQVLPHLGHVASARTERILAHAARLLDGAHTRRQPARTRPTAHRQRLNPAAPQGPVRGEGRLPGVARSTPRKPAASLSGRV
jgi:hypothetical protein